MLFGEEVLRGGVLVGERLGLGDDIFPAEEGSEDFLAD